MLFLQEKLDEDYHQRLEENKRKAEERTTKKRLKRLKKKKNQKNMKKAKLNQEPNKTESSSDQSEDEDGDNSGEDSASSLKLNKCDSYDEKKPSDQNQSNHVTEEN